MKVYELIEKLMQLPAGLDVAAQTYKTVREVKNGTEVDVNENEEEVYSIGNAIKDMDSDSKTVYLYF